jgi:hypothetical protein
LSPSPCKGHRESSSIVYVGLRLAGIVLILPRAETSSTSGASEPQIAGSAEV